MCQVWLVQEDFIHEDNFQQTIETLLHCTFILQFCVRQQGITRRWGPKPEFWCVMPSYHGVTWRNVTSDYVWEAPIYWPTMRWEDAMPGHEFSTLSREAPTESFQLKMLFCTVGLIVNFHLSSFQQNTCFSEVVSRETSIETSEPQQGLI